MKRAGRYLDGSLKGYVTALASRSMIPGGGSAAALCGALGAALNLMVINYSMDEKKRRGPEKFIVLAEKQKRILKDLLLMVDEDCRKFSSLMKALSSREPGDIEGKFMRSALVPLRVSREVMKSLEITSLFLEDCNRNLMSDVGSAARLLEAAFLSAELNVMVNLKHMKDPTFRRETRNELNGIKKRMAGVLGGIISSVDKEMGDTSE